jgi:hypothetical protein
MRSISRRDAMPARARSLAIRWGPDSRGCGLADTWSRFVPRRGTGRLFVRCVGEVIGVHMLFGKHKRVVKRILIVEDEPLTAFDNENILGDAGYEIVATIDQFDDAIGIIEREQVDLC